MALSFMRKMVKGKGWQALPQPQQNAVLRDACRDALKRIDVAMDILFLLWLMEQLGFGKNPDDVREFLESRRKSVTAQEDKDVKWLMASGPRRDVIKTTNRVLLNTVDGIIRFTPTAIATLLTEEHGKTTVTDTIGAMILLGFLDLIQTEARDKVILPDDGVLGLFEEYIVMLGNIPGSATDIESRGAVIPAS